MVPTFTPVEDFTSVDKRPRGLPKTDVRCLSSLQSGGKASIPRSDVGDSKLLKHINHHAGAQSLVVRKSSTSRVYQMHTLPISPRREAAVRASTRPVSTEPAPHSPSHARYRSLGDALSVSAGVGHFCSLRASIIRSKNPAMPGHGAMRNRSGARWEAGHCPRRSALGHGGGVGAKGRRGLRKLG